MSRRALENQACPSVENGRLCGISFIVQKDVALVLNGRDLDWATAVKTESTECLATPMNAEDPLFILYTSGSTGNIVS